MKSITFAQFRERFSFAAETSVFRMDSTALVYKGFDHELKRDVAVKIIADEAKIRRYPSLKAMSKLFKLEHGHLVHYFDFLRIEPSSEHAGFDVLVMDFIGGGDLSRAIGQGSDESKGRIVEGMLGGLGALHQHGMFHGNLKVGNILLQDIGHLHVRMSDYGYVVTQQYEVTGNQYRRETIQYLAPEQIQPENFALRGTVRENVDFWALGMLVYELFTGKYVFGEGEFTSSGLMTRILHGDLPSDLDQLPGNYGELVKACLVRNAKQRPRKISHLRRILDGGHIWEEGRLRRKPKVKALAMPKIPSKVKCGHCKQMTRVKSGVCSNCKKPLRGPIFLKQFRRPSAAGYWAMLFMTVVFIPLGFLYYDYYVQCGLDSGGTCVWEDWFNANVVNLQVDRAQDVEFRSKFILELSVIGIGAVLSSIFFIVWFARVSRNLSALGSQKQNFHWFFLILTLAVYVIGQVLLLQYPVPAIILMLAGLIMPLFIFQEVWRGSNPNYLEQSDKWKKSPGSAMIFAWWLISILLPMVVVLPLLQISVVGEGPKVWFLMTTGLVAAYWLISMLLVLRINRRQVSKFWAWVRQGGLS